MDVGNHHLLQWKIKAKKSYKQEGWQILRISEINTIYIFLLFFFHSRVLCRGNAQYRVRITGSSHCFIISIFGCADLRYLSSNCRFSKYKLTVHVFLQLYKLGTKNPEWLFKLSVWISASATGKFYFLFNNIVNFYCSKKWSQQFVLLSL